MYINNKSNNWSIWSILSIISLALSIFTFYKGYDKMTNYYNNENYYELNKNAYVGGDAYNYIINGNYATSFFVLTAMFVLASIGLMILHYISNKRIVIQQQSVSKNWLEDIESNLPEI